MKLRFALALLVFSLGVFLPRPALALVCDPDCASTCAGTTCDGGGTYHAACCAGGYCDCNCNWQNQADCTS